jgi:hypothetical protein
VLILDADHLSALDWESGAAVVMLKRLDDSGARVGTTIVCIEAQLRGLLALIKSVKDDFPRASLADLVVAHMRRNPKRQELPFAQLVEESLSINFPCKR